MDMMMAAKINISSLVSYFHTDHPFSVEVWSDPVFGSPPQ